MRDREVDSDPLNVAVLVVSRNRPRDLRRCLESIARQSNSAHVVLVDNASMPPVRRDAVPEPLTVTMVRSEKELGVSAARNLAISHADARILVFLDDDATFESDDAIGRIRALFGAAAADVLGLNCLAVGSGTERESPPEQMRLIRGISGGGRRAREIIGEVCIPCAVFVGAGFCMRAGVVERIGGFREDFRYGGEEYHLCLRAIEAHFEVQYAQSIRVLHFHSMSWRLSGLDREVSHLRNRFATAAELIPLAFLPAALVLPAMRTWWRLRANGWKVVLGPAVAAFRESWVSRRRPVSIRTVRTVLCRRGRL